jgi:type VI secretion system secreted protein VgrG
VAEPTGTTRDIAVSTPLGDDKVVFKSMQGEEHLSRLFEFDVTVLSTDRAIDANKLLGENVTLRLRTHDNSTRYFNGFVTDFSQLPEPTVNFARYRLVLRPWLWFLTQVADCRIFQELDVPEIIKQVFRDRGFSDFEARLERAYRTVEYCVQYCETDFNFVSRLMEQEGIYYFFEHDNGVHKLILADGLSAHNPSPKYEEVPYYIPEPGAIRSRDHISDWVVNRQIRPGKYATSSYDFKAPRKLLSATGSDIRPHSHADSQIYDYLGTYTEAADGQHYADVRMQELACRHQVVCGGGDARGLVSGATFKLTNFAREDQNGEYLLLGVEHSLEADDYESTTSTPALQYSCTFTTIESRTQYRAPQVTRKPEIRGPQTAVVVGKSGEEIFTDEHGRVKVKFPWDRYAAGDENSSCWIRVSQALAGQGWGGIILPRVGHEVIVEHIDGDPDRPIVTGRVYNGDNKPPYPLPANQTKSTLKSNSSKGGGGFNELRFDDTKDSEQVYMHAQMNFDLRVLNDRFETVENDSHLKIRNDGFTEIEHDRNDKVGNDHFESIAKDRHLTVEGLEAKRVAKSLSLLVEGDVGEEFKKDHSETVSGDYYLKGTNVVIEGTSNITLKVGGTSIAIDSSGVKIKTTGQIALEGAQGISLKGMKIDAKADTTATIEATATTEVKSSGATIVKGTIVQIN